MGLLPNQKFKVVETKDPLTILDMNIKGMEEYALIHRPELKKSHYDEAISIQETKVGMASLLPGLNFNAAWTHSSNDHLMNKTNLEYGSVMGANLLNVFMYPKIKKINQTNTEIIKEKRLALSMAVLSQVHLANIDYSLALEEYDTAERYYQVSRKITEQIKNAQKIAKFGNLELIREQASLLVAELRHDLAYTKLQYAVGKIYTSVENDIRKQKNNDTLWKVYENRWPKDKTGKWYYKTDTSSDELDGHYFLYGLYYDLVAETEDEKERVRAHIKKLTDHLIDHDFQLVDHDGKPTRWSRFNPYELNHDKNWFVERGLNSLSMLSYLSITHHITGDDRYRELSNMLIEDHGYAQNMTDQKFNRGVGTGNHSDDEMAFMSYYHLINYETDPELKSRYAFSMYMNWMLEAPELNPFFNFAFRAATASEDFVDAWGTYDLEPHPEWLDESMETLIRFPLDRLNWSHTNSHRTDIQKLHSWNRTFDQENNSRKGYRVNGKVFPIDERHINHWNHDPWNMNTGGSGTELSTGMVYLLPYYMGLYHGFINE